MSTDSGLPRLGRWYVGLIIAAGSLLIALSLIHLFTGAIDPRWLAFAGLTVLSASVTIKVPALPAQISVSETFVFTSLLVFGPEAGVLTVAIDGLVASLGIHRRKSYAIYKTLFNMTAPALSLWIAWRVSLGLAGIAPLVDYATPIDRLLPLLFVLAAFHFLLNSWLIALAIGIQTRTSAVTVWAGSFLWVAINYLGGASVSVLLVLLYHTPVVKTVSLGIIIPLLTMFYLMFKIGMGRAEDAIAHLTAIKLAADERAQLEAQFRQAQKLEAVGQLAGGIAHDFNNILAVILGNAEAAIADTDPSHPARASLEEIQLASNRGKDIVQQLLTFCRLKPQDRHVISIEPVVAEATKFLHATIPSEVEIVLALEAGVPPVRADATQIQQVIFNLCTNAWHALEEQPGRIDIRLQTVTLDAAAARLLAGLRPGRFACLSISDTGKGMDAAMLQSIFDPFFTTKAPGKGTGLGLSVVQGIVAAHDGAITVESQPGHGTTFHVYLPAADAVIPDSRMAPATSESQGQGQHVLFLDDEEALVRLGKRTLERLGFRVTGFTHAAAAVQAFRANPGQFDVVITDLNMPGASGMVVARELLTVRPDLPVLLCSGHVTDRVREEAHSAGIRHVLYKPNTMEEFSTTLHHAIHQAPTTLTQPVHPAHTAPPAH